MFSQFAILSVAKRDKCNNFQLIKNMQLNERHIEQLGRSDGIKTTLHCQERVFLMISVTSGGLEWKRMRPKNSRLFKILLPVFEK